MIYVRTEFSQPKIQHMFPLQGIGHTSSRLKVDGYKKKNDKKLVVQTNVCIQGSFFSIQSCSPAYR